jgi:putative oxidoreductase
MSKTSTASATRGHTDAGSRLLGRRALGAARGLLVIVFVIAGLTKLGGAHSMVKLFAQIGVGQSFRYLVGTLELAGAVALLIPSLVGPAARAPRSWLGSTSSPTRPKFGSGSALPSCWHQSSDACSRYG